MNGSPTVSTDDDASLLASSRAGDVGAFGQLIERYHNLVCAIAYASTGDRVASEDIAQETFFAAWKGLGGLRDPDKLRGWLCGIARNLAIKSTRRQRRETLTDTDDLVGEVSADAGPLAAMLTKEAEATVWAALQQLPPTYREPLVLFYREDQSIRQVAEGLGLSEEAAKQRLARGRQSLRENIGDLVERALKAGRPRKAAAAAVIALIIAAQGKTALAAPSVAKSASPVLRWGMAGLGAAACAVAAIAIVSKVSRPAEVAQPSSPAGSSADLAELRRAHDVWQTRTGGTRKCELHGRITNTDGTPLAGALVAALEHNLQTATLDPIVIETNARGEWRTPATAGQYTLAISARGLHARSQVAACVPAHDEDLVIALQPGGAELRGTISDTGGGPIAGATVWILDPLRPSELFMTRTAPDGAYDVLLDRGLYAVLAIHPEYTLEVRPLTLGGNAVREDITLLPGASVEGTVVDGDGKPVSGARVRALAPTPAGGDGQPVRWTLAAFYNSIIPATTDENGRFQLRGLTPGNIQLAARSSVYATATPTSIDLTLAEPKSDVTIAVAPARTLSGFVVARGDQRHGLAGAQVFAVREEAPLAAPVTTTADGAGYFELAGLARGSYRIAVLTKGYVPYVSELPLALVERDTTDAVIALERGARVRGRVEPAEGATVRFQQPTGLPASYLKTAMLRADVDAQGNFAFDAVPPGDYVLVATAFGRRGELPVHTTTEDQGDLRVKLDVEPSIRGRVVDEAGTKLTGVLVAATPMSSKAGGMSMHTTVRTDDNGAFEIVGISAGAYDIRVYDARGQRAWAGTDKRRFKGRRIEVPASGASETLQVARATGRISGVVVGADHRPIADSWIEIRAREAHGMPELFLPPPILTDAAGRFAVDGIAGSDLIIEATGPDGRQRAVATAAPGATVQLELAPLVMLSGRITFEGKAVDADVLLHELRNDERKRVRANAGQFSLLAIAGQHELVVTSSAGYARLPVTVGRDAAIVDVALTPWASIRGKAVGSDGAPAANASIHLRDALEPALLTTGADGSFVIDHVIAGHNELVLFPASDATMPAIVDVDIAAGQQLDIGTVGDRLRSARTTASRSADLGLQMFVSVERPTPAQLAAVATDPLVASRGSRDASAGLWLVAVDANGPAARAGLRAGDRIVGVGLSKIDGGASAGEMMMSLSQPWRSKGRSVSWSVMRGDREVRVDVLVAD